MPKIKVYVDFENEEVKSEHEISRDINVSVDIAIKFEKESCLEATYSRFTEMLGKTETRIKHDMRRALRKRAWREVNKNNTVYEFDSNTEFRYGDDENLRRVYVKFKDKRILSYHEYEREQLIVGLDARKSQRWQEIAIKKTYKNFEEFYNAIKRYGEKTVQSKIECLAHTLAAANFSLQWTEFTVEI